MATTSNVLQILIEAKGAEQAASKIDQVNAVLGKTDGVAGGSARSIGRIGQAAQTVAGQAKSMHDQLGKPVAIKGQQSFASLGKYVERSREKVKQLEKSVLQAGTSAKKAGADSKGFADAFRNLPGVARVAALTAGLVGLKLALSGVARGAQEAFTPIVNLENSVNRFNTAMASVGQFSSLATRNALKFASAMESVTTFSDDAVLKTQALIAQIGQVGGVTLERATRAALDLAAAIGTDLRTAAVGMGKAVKGNTDTLSEYGIVIGANVPKAERFAAAIATVEQTFGGAAQGQVATFEGSLKQLSNEWDNLRKAFTAPFIPVLTQKIKGLREAIDELRGAVSGAGDDYGLVASVGDDLLAKAKQAQSTPKPKALIDRGTRQLKRTPDTEALEKYNALLKDVNSKDFEVRIAAAINGGDIQAAEAEVLKIEEAAKAAGGALGGAFDKLARFANFKLEAKLRFDEESYKQEVANVFKLISSREVQLGVGQEKLDEAVAKWDAFVNRDQVLALQIEDEGLDATLERFNSLTDKEASVTFKARFQGLEEGQIDAIIDSATASFDKITDQAIKFAEANKDGADAMAATRDRLGELLPLMRQAADAQIGASNNVFANSGMDFNSNIFDNVGEASSVAAEQVVTNFAAVPEAVDPIWEDFTARTQETLGSGLVNVLSAPFLSMINQTENLKKQMVDAIKAMVAAMIKELLKLAVFKLFKTVLSGGTSTIFDGFASNIFDTVKKGGLDQPNPPTDSSKAAGGGQGALYQPPAVLEFARRAPASEFARAGQFKGALQLDDSSQRSQLVTQTSSQPIEITIHAMDSKDIERSLRTGSLGRAFSNIGKGG